MNKEISVEINDVTTHSQASLRPTIILSSLKNRLKAVKQKWGPLMAAKEHLDDEYDFLPGRYAGQDDSQVFSQ
ncbi:uncharacterized protein N7469_011666 [Penicillium citrinum]|uniref:Uncharacterized protein n=1 Tax=Penicillium citrinum TaxID=5077 RepID=A0A9W9N8F6_PENCI|nr:uncharacterized protein N7469_011666 [Penicillium citrinum]KAJ5215175.1 hypothetical protein N7469_011666 [Penicillium citrinum]